MRDAADQLPRGPLTAIIGCSSMADGNMISDETGSFTAPGTPSETTSAASAPPFTPTVSQSDGGVPLGTPPDRKADNASFEPSPVSWQMLPDNGFSKEDI